MWNGSHIERGQHRFAEIAAIEHALEGANRLVVPHVLIYGEGDARLFADLHDFASLFVIDAERFLSKDAADEAIAVSGRKSIPVIAFSDGTHQVEPSNADLHEKLVSIGALSQ